jgi:hypothetical protein
MIEVLAILMPLNRNRQQKVPRLARDQLRPSGNDPLANNNTGKASNVITMSLLSRATCRSADASHKASPSDHLNAIKDAIVITRNLSKRRSTSQVSQSDPPAETPPTLVIVTRASHTEWALSHASFSDSHSSGTREPDSVDLNTVGLDRATCRSSAASHKASPSEPLKCNNRRHSYQAKLLEAPQHLTSLTLGSTSKSSAYVSHRHESQPH